jgi:centromere/kinetochore protein ZW10
VIGCVADFESQLIELGYVPDGTDSLTQYAKDVNVHFANQKCQDLLVKARKILLSDMHNTLLIEDEKERGGLLLLDKPPNVDEEVVREKVAGFDEGTLKKATFHFPSCQVSRNVKDLVDLAYDTLIEATESNQCGVQLFFAVRDMFELFRAIVPSYHKKILVITLVLNSFTLSDKVCICPLFAFNYRKYKMKVKHWYLTLL